MQIEKISLDQLKPLEKNVRRHGDVQITELKRSVQQYGQTRALVIDENNTILIGNGLYLALKELNYSDAECYKMTGLSETQKKKLILSDNKIYALGSDDFTNIRDYIGEIVGMGDLDIAGFSEDILKGMTQTFEQSVNEIQTQGIITDVKLTTPQPTPVVNTPQSAPDAPQATVAPQTVNSPSNMPQIQTEKSMRTVICPSCGEVIYID